ncbi:hypothetical protein [Lentzea terrae]|uniref:hypothetical protein n=1 Tax=Lentzea terrae TaxID=2200761 RepID=UPI000DD34CE2|nr:hypothetical protein [Lentzea terrae]
MGPLLSTHPVDLHRRRPLGVAAAAVALISSLLLVLMFLIDLDGVQYVLLFAGYPLLISAPAAFLLLRPRAPETFELHEGGLAHLRGGDRREWRWEQVRAITVVQNGPVSRSGAGVLCTIRFEDGEVVRFDGSTENGGEIAAALGENCAEAAREDVNPRWRPRAVAVLGGVTVIGAGVATWAAVRFPQTAEGGQFGLAMLAIVCGAPAVISLILLISVLVTGRR